MTDTNGNGLGIELIRLTNIGGIRGTLEIRPEPGVTYLEGKNGLGKSSGINGIAALMGAPINDLLTNGEDEGESYLEMSDGAWFRRVIERPSDERPKGKNDLSAYHPDTGRVSAAAKFLQATLASAHVSPAEILAASDQEAAEYVLKLATLTVSPQEVKDALGEDVEDPGVDTLGHALEVLDRVHSALYDERTGENRVAKESRTTVEQLKQSIPEEVPEPDQIEARIAEMEAKREGLLAGRKKAAQEAAQEARQESDAALEKVRGAIGHKKAVIAELEATLREARAGLESLEQEEASLTESRDNAETQAVDAAVAPFREPAATLQAEIESLRRELKNATAQASSVENTRRMVAEHERKAEAAHEKSRALTAAMARIDALRAAKASDLPIPGVSIQDGRLFVGGVPWNRVNTAERVELAFAITGAQESRVNLIISDNLESLDSENRAAVEQKAREKGWHVIAARVTDGDELTVRTASSDPQPALALEGEAAGG